MRVESAKQQWQILIGVGIALMAVISLVSGRNVAQRQIAVALDASQRDVLWMINIYAVSLAALLLPLGAVGDRWGQLVTAGGANLCCWLGWSCSAQRRQRPVWHP